MKIAPVKYRGKRQLTQRFRHALRYAAELHSTQTRKGTDEPYIGHLLGVAMLVIQHGGDEDEVIAALLHDAVEDQGGQLTLQAIRQKFGKRVAAIVEGCSDAFELPKPPWRERKLAHLAHVRWAPADVRLVCAADKLHNARTILDDYRVMGDRIWQRFNGGKAGTLWYYREMAKTLRAAGSNQLVDELGRVVRQIERLAKNGRKEGRRKRG